MTGERTAPQSPCNTQRTRHERAFTLPILRPMLSGWRNFKTWQEDGAVDATHLANRIYKQLLAAYEPPPLDPTIREELQAFVSRRAEEGGAPVG